MGLDGVLLEYTNGSNSHVGIGELLCNFLYNRTYSQYRCQFTFTHFVLILVNAWVGTTTRVTIRSIDHQARDM